MIGLIFLAFLASVCMLYVGFNGDSNIVCFLGIFCGAMLALVALMALLAMMGVVS